MLPKALTLADLHPHLSSSFYTFMSGRLLLEPPGLFLRVDRGEAQILREIDIAGEVDKVRRPLDHNPVPLRCKKRILAFGLSF